MVEHKKSYSASPQPIIVMFTTDFYPTLIFFSIAYIHLDFPKIYEIV